jgi:hypothetical protein
MDSAGLLCAATELLLGRASFGDLIQQLRFSIVVWDFVLDLELEMELKLELEQNNNDNRRELNIRTVLSGSLKSDERSWHITECVHSGCTLRTLGYVDGRAIPWSSTNSKTLRLISSFPSRLILRSISHPPRPFALPMTGSPLPFNPTSRLIPSCFSPLPLLLSLLFRLCVRILPAIYTVQSEASIEV